MSRLATTRTVLGQVLVCVGCCCGRPDKGKPSVPVDRLKTEWKQRKLLRRVHLTISGCLGPCDLVNVVCIVTPAGVTWLGGLACDEEYEALLEWATRSAEQGHLLPLPARLAVQSFESPILPAEGRACGETPPPPSKRRDTGRPRAQWPRFAEKS